MSLASPYPAPSTAGEFRSCVDSPRSVLRSNQFHTPLPGSPRTHRSLASGFQAPLQTPHLYAEELSAQRAAAGGAAAAAGAPCEHHTELSQGLASVQEEGDDLRDRLAALRNERERLWAAAQEAGLEVAQLREAAAQEPWQAAAAEIGALQQRIAAQEEELRRGAEELRAAAAHSDGEQRLLEQEADALQHLSDEQQRELGVLQQQLEMKLGADADVRSALEREINDLRLRALAQREQQQALAKAVDDAERALLRDRDRLHLEAETARVESRGKESNARYAAKTAEVRRNEARRRRARVLEELEAAQRSVATAEGDVAAAKATLQRQSGELSEAAANLEAAGASRDDAAATARAELAKYETQIRELTRQHDERCRQREKLGRAAAATAEELASLERRAEELAAAEAELDARVAAVREESERVAEAAAAAAARRKAAEERMEAREQSEEERKVRGATAEAAAQAQRLNAETDVAVAHLEAEVEELRGALEAEREDAAHHVVLVETARDNARAARRRERAARRAAERAAQIHKARLTALRDEEDLLRRVLDELRAGAASAADPDERLRIISRLRALADDRNRELMRRGKDLIDARRQVARAAGLLGQVRTEADRDAEDAREREELLRLHAQLLRQREGDVAAAEEQNAALARAEQELTRAVEELRAESADADRERGLVVAAEQQTQLLADRAAAAQERADAMLQGHWDTQVRLQGLHAEAAAERTRREAHWRANRLPESPRAAVGESGAPASPPPRHALEPTERRLLEARAADPIQRAAPDRQRCGEVLTDGWQSLAEARARRRETAERAAAEAAAAAARQRRAADFGAAGSPRSGRGAAPAPASAHIEALLRADDDSEDRLLRLKRELSRAKEQNARRSLLD
eukprot:TRINITY_DN1199_c0_g1_i2.p1 TRINITY_DN1199_c0_g1~~TRINITY_DN1199_c0_g1_i2.p1  ORF type:complete len:881 (+),score=332.79 TRINITY_DN1199_c0_g1_i2:125-2767(+)